VVDLSPFKTILIIRLSSLGDALLATPLIRSIKNKYPSIKLDFLVRKEYKGALEKNLYISELFLYERQTENNAALLKNLSNYKYDLIIDLQNNFRTAGIRKKIGDQAVRFNKRSFDKFLLVKFKINNLKNEPQIPVRYADSIDQSILDDEGLDLFTDRAPSKELIEDKNFIGIAPGSRHYTKMWPAENYILLSKKLSDAGFTIVLFGGNTDYEICNKINKETPHSINLCNDNDLLQTAADMKKMKTLICNDSGMMHVACAVKTPVAAFFGSSVKEFGFMPYKNKNLILENNSLSCRPCSHIGREKCPKGHFKCMREITPDTAFEKILRFINS
jgi:ADP-heptose:LPS heptosyltransferase